MAQTESSIPPPPPGGDQNRGWQLLAVHSILSGICIILVLLRFHVRIFIVKKFGLDDYCIALGLISVVVSLILDVYQVRWGWGRHLYYLVQSPASRAHLQEATKLSQMNQINTILAILFIKFSIAILLLRVFGTKRFVRWIIYSIMAFVFVTTVISFSMVLAQCRPLDKLWNKKVPGKCWSPQTVINIGYYNGAVAVFSDWALSTVPIVVIWNLQMTVRKKVGIAILMGIGYFTGVTALIRTVMLKNLDAEDITWAIIPTDNWAGAETHLGIIAACIPAIHPLYSSSQRKRLLDWSRIFSSNHSSKNTKQSKDIRPAPRTPARKVQSWSGMVKGAEYHPWWHREREESFKFEDLSNTTIAKSSHEDGVELLSPIHVNPNVTLEDVLDAPSSNITVARDDNAHLERAMAEQV